MTRTQRRDRALALRQAEKRARNMAVCCRAIGDERGRRAAAFDVQAIRRALVNVRQGARPETVRVF